LATSKNAAQTKVHAPDQQHGNGRMKNVLTGGVYWEEVVPAYLFHTLFISDCAILAVRRVD
jgi:hypothetical protein